MTKAFSRKIKNNKKKLNTIRRLMSTTIRRRTQIITGWAALILARYGFAEVICVENNYSPMLNFNHQQERCEIAYQLNIQPEKSQTISEKVVVTGSGAQFAVVSSSSESAMTDTAILVKSEATVPGGVHGFTPGFTKIKGVVHGRPGRPQNPTIHRNRQAPIFRTPAKPVDYHQGPRGTKLPGHQNEGESSKPKRISASKKRSRSRIRGESGNKLKKTEGSPLNKGKSTTTKVREKNQPDPDKGGSHSFVDYDQQNQCPNSNLQEKEPEIVRGTERKNLKNKKKNRRAVSRERAVEAYQEFILEMKEKGYGKLDDIPESRFLELATNPETGNFEEKSIIEAKGGLEGELQGMFKDLRRPENPENKLDFQAKLPDDTLVFLDHKKMVDFNKLAEEKGIEVGHFPSHETVAFNMGRASVEQKRIHIPRNDAGEPIRTLGLPYSESDVIHLYNFKDMTDPAELPGLKQALLNEAKEAGHTGTGGMLFLTDLDLKEF